MAIHTRINPFSKQNNDTGFGNNASSYGGRFVNRDGSFNLKKEGMPFWDRVSIYHGMLNLPAWKFIVIIVSFYFCLNVLYTSIYLLIGTNQFQGMIVLDQFPHIGLIFGLGGKPVIDLCRDLSLAFPDLHQAMIFSHHV